MENKNLLKVLLIGQTLLLLVYTILAAQNDSVNLFTVFLTNIQSLNWNGQFNLDFSCYLMLSGLWMMWRNRFSAQSILLGLAAMIIGIIFFAPYLLYQIMKEKGNLQKVLVGER